MSIDADWFKWFVGLVDGEGSFYIACRKHTIVTTRLQIGLRDDDISVLLEIQARLQMGTLHYRRRDNELHRTPNAKPLAEWSVAKHSDCYKLVTLFDRFPLKTKKRRDYEVWRKATLELQKSPYQRNQAELRHLYRKLKLVHKYKSSDTHDPEPSTVQLGLWTTSYEDLSEPEKDSDRKEADRVLAILESRKE